MPPAFYKFTCTEEVAAETALSVASCAEQVASTLCKDGGSGGMGKESITLFSSGEAGHMAYTSQPLWEGLL